MVVVEQRVDCVGERGEQPTGQAASLLSLWSRRPPGVGELARGASTAADRGRRLAVGRAHRDQRRHEVRPVGFASNQLHARRLILCFVLAWLGAELDLGRLGEPHEIAARVAQLGQGQKERLSVRFCARRRRRIGQVESQIGLQLLLAAFLAGKDLDLDVARAAGAPVVGHNGGLAADPDRMRCHIDGQTGELALGLSRGELVLQMLRVGRACSPWVAEDNDRMWEREEEEVEEEEE